MGPRVTRPDPSKFPDQPRWATWIAERNPQFKLHTTLGQAKNALSGRRGLGRYITIEGKREYEHQVGEGWVYEYSTPEGGKGCWQERWYVPPGVWKSEHPLWKRLPKVARTSKPIPQKRVDAAIASIMEAVEKE